MNTFPPRLLESETVSAIELSPWHRGAHECNGEAYPIVGNLDGAEMRVAALRDNCLLSCEELEDLEKAVAAYKAKR